MEDFETVVAPQVFAVRRQNQPYLKWIEECAKDRELAPSIIMQIEIRLKQIGYDGELGLPDHKDPAGIYLLKASHSYLVDCTGHHSRFNNQHNPEDGFSDWLHSTGRLWLINDAQNQTLIIALNHTYSHAAAEAEGGPRLEGRDLYQAHTL